MRRTASESPTDRQCDGFSAGAVVSISSLVSRLRGESSSQDEELENDEDELFDPTDEAFGPILRDGLAAESVDMDAMLQRIEEHDQGDLQRCWTWVYLLQ